MSRWSVVKIDNYKDIWGYYSNTRDITMGVLFRAPKAISEGGYGGHPPAVIWLDPLHPQRGRKILRFFVVFVE